MKRSLLTPILLLAAACHNGDADPVVNARHRPPTEASSQEAPGSERVSKAELDEFLDWVVGFRKEQRRINEEIRAHDDDPVEVKMERASANQRMLDELFRGYPFHGTTKGKALERTIFRLSLSGVFHPEPDEVQKLKRKYGATLIDSILEHEARIKERLD